MSGIKANWHLADLDLPTDEEAAMAEIAQLQSEGDVIDLAKPSAMLMDSIVESMRREGRYAQMFDLSCDLKWTVDTGHDQVLLRNPCRTCPHFTDSEDEMRSLICTTGRAQEDMIDAYYCALSTEALDAQMLVAFEADADAAQELAEAVL